MSLRTRILMLVFFATFAPAPALIFTSLRERTEDVANARQQLAATAGRIAATRKLSQGDFTARVGKPYPRGELGGVMGVLDATAERIEAQSGEILRLNEGLERSVAERTSALEGALRELEARTRDVESRNRLLAEADLYKSQFLANMTHELRTRFPLRASSAAAAHSRLRCR